MLFTRFCNRHPLRSTGRISPIIIFSFIYNIHRDVPFSSFYWYTYEILKPKYATFLRDNRSSIRGIYDFNIDDGKPDSIVSFACAATAGIMASLFTHPFDVLKTRQQLSEFRVGAGCSNRIGKVDLSSKMMKVRNNMDISVLYREGGIRALYKGIHLRMATVVPAGAIMITVYEAVKSMKF